LSRRWRSLPANGGGRLDLRDPVEDAAARLAARRPLFGRAARAEQHVEGDARVAIIGSGSLGDAQLIESV
jgi:hypothetical protein